MPLIQANRINVQEAGNTFAALAPSVDPIEDNQLLLRAPVTRDSAHRPTIYCSQIPTLADNVDAASRTQKYHTKHFQLTNLNGVRIEKSGVAMCSDGFVGAELNVQSTKITKRPRPATTDHRKRRKPNHEGLSLARGCLPAPPLEPFRGVTSVRSYFAHTEDCSSAETSARTGDDSWLSPRCVLRDVECSGDLSQPHR